VKLSATAGGQCCARRRLALVELAEPACLGTAKPHLNDPWNCERRFVEFVREAGRCMRRALGACVAFGGASRAAAAGNCTSTTGWELVLMLGVRNGEELGTDGSWERTGVGSGRELGADG
jgi:hypothetical protein